MRKLTLTWTFVITAVGLLGTPGCKDNDANTDAAVADMAKKSVPDMVVVLSQCGHPGDPGNSVGVGKYCTSVSDCMGGMMKTNICSALGNGATPSDSDTYFCTIYPCHPDAGVSECAESATCVCGSGGGTSGCACTPNSCLGGGGGDMGGTSDMGTSAGDGGGNKDGGVTIPTDGGLPDAL